MIKEFLKGATKAMDIKQFQNKLAEMCKTAAECGQKLTAEQLKDFLEELKPDKEQLLQIIKYFRLQGITIEGMELAEESDEGKESAKRTLTAEEENYVKEYKGFLNRTFEPIRAAALFRALAAGEAAAKRELSELYLSVAADLAVEMHGGEMLLADLIQEANLVLLTALDQAEPRNKDDLWLRSEIRKGLKEVIGQETEQHFSDDCLVEKVQQLEGAVKDLSENEDGTESKFTVGELAIILDMEIDEIRDVLRLTGDDVQDEDEMPEESAEPIDAVDAEAVQMDEINKFLDLEDL